MVGISNIPIIMKYLIIFISLVFLISSQYSHAQHAGGNGGGYEGQVRFIQETLTQWIDKNYKNHTLSKKLNLASIQMNEDVFYGKYVEAVNRTGNNIHMIGEKIEIAGYTRACRNFSSGKIECNLDEWRSAINNQSYNYLLALIFHEYLGVANIESNESDNSSFQVSYQIYRYVDQLVPNLKKIINNYPSETNVCQGSVYIDVKNLNQYNDINQILISNGFTISKIKNESTHIATVSFDGGKNKFFDDSGFYCKSQLLINDQRNANPVINVTDEYTFHDIAVPTKEIREETCYKRFFNVLLNSKKYCDAVTKE